MVLLHPEQAAPSALWKLLACCAIVANALWSAGILTFPLMSPVLASRCSLTQPQLTTIVLAAMMGQYPFAALTGKMIDRYGPSLCSVVAAVLYFTAFGSFSYQVSVTHTAESTPTTSISTHLAISFGLAGIGTVFSYFSFLFAASRLFPGYPGLASGTSMALFGLSPLFLTSVASKWFTDHTTGLLHVVQFTAYLALISGLVHLFGALAFSFAQCNSKDIQASSPDPETQPHEGSRLLPREERVEYTPESHIKTDTTLGFLTDRHVWLLIIFCICILGTAEMVISNVGTIVAALPSTTSDQETSTPPTANLVDNTPRQVQLISIANTLTRISVGPLADFLSPVASYLPDGGVVYARKHHISRASFLFGAAALLTFTFLWTSAGIITQEGLWALSLGTGISYSATFTVIPSIISSIWGLKNMGRNFGIVMYAPFVGNPIFSYLYAFVSQSHTVGEGICRGRECWQTTFRFTTMTSLLALIIATVLWRQWKGSL